MSPYKVCSDCVKQFDQRPNKFIEAKSSRGSLGMWILVHPPQQNGYKVKLQNAEEKELVSLPLPPSWTEIVFTSIRA